LRPLGPSAHQVVRPGREQTGHNVKEYIQDRNGVELTDAAEAKQELQRLVGLLPEKLIRPGARVALHDEAGNMLDDNGSLNRAVGSERRH
jgi:hypothetical protein